MFQDLHRPLCAGIQRCCDQEPKCARSPKNPAARLSGVVPHLTSEGNPDFIEILYCLLDFESWNDWAEYSKTRQNHSEISFVFSNEFWSKKKLEWVRRATYIAAFRFNDKLSWDLCIQMAESWDNYWFQAVESWVSWVWPIARPDRMCTGLESLSRPCARNNSVLVNGLSFRFS